MGEWESQRCVAQVSGMTRRSNADAGQYSAAMSTQTEAHQLPHWMERLEQNSSQGQCKPCYKPPSTSESVWGTQTLKLAADPAGLSAHDLSAASLSRKRAGCKLESLCLSQAPRLNVHMPPMQASIIAEGAAPGST